MRCLHLYVLSICLGQIFQFVLESEVFFDLVVEFLLALVELSLNCNYALVAVHQVVLLSLNLGEQHLLVLLI